MDDKRLYTLIGRYGRHVGTLLYAIEERMTWAWLYVIAIPPICVLLNMVMELVGIMLGDRLLILLGLIFLTPIVTFGIWLMLGTIYAIFFEDFYNDWKLYLAKTERKEKE